VQLLRSDTQGPIRAVVRAVPIAVLRPMIGATEAVGQTLLGLRNSLDPAAAIDEGSKWKRR
jgi:autophagy-related protein 2